mmetsp:Transcript_113013/g.258863  ORF Transcript_113013/g.258863 Transcript_113013/m.258863 type:complete len:248 (-) Transcript_113013:29-772(-)
MDVVPLVGVQHGGGAFKLDGGAFFDHGSYDRNGVLVDVQGLESGQPISHDQGSCGSSSSHHKLEIPICGHPLSIHSHQGIHRLRLPPDLQLALLRRLRPGQHLLLPRVQNLEGLRFHPRLPVEYSDGRVVENLESTGVLLLGAENHVQGIAVWPHLNSAMPLQRLRFGPHKRACFTGLQHAHRPRPPEVLLRRGQRPLQMRDLLCRPHQLLLLPRAQLDHQLVGPSLTHFQSQFGSVHSDVARDDVH